MSDTASGPPQQRRVAVVIDDEADIRSLVEIVLTQSGFETVTASNGKDGVEAVRRHQPVITTLDVNMPGMDGFTAAQLIREVSSTYIIMLTALADEIDVVQGLGAGADDYLVKPFRPRELRARIESAMRRLGRPEDGAVAPGPAAAADGGAAPADARPDRPAWPAPRTTDAPPAAQTAPYPQWGRPAEPAPEQSWATGPSTRQSQVAPVPAAAARPVDDDEGVLRHDGLEVDVVRHLVRVDDQPVELTVSEFELLAAVLSSGRRVRSKADLVLTLRGESYVTDYFVTDADKRAVEVHMANLRRKIGDSSTTPRWIETVRGVGYRLTAG